MTTSLTYCLIGLASLSALGAGYFFSKKFADVAAQNSIKRSTKSGRRRAQNPNDFILDLMKMESKKPVHVFAKGPLRNASEMRSRIKFAGLANEISVDGFVDARLKVAFICAGIGAVIGALVSAASAAVLFICGFAYGFIHCRKLIEQVACNRGAELERNLPSMLDVLCLGVRSGLSFDRSLEIYCASFASPLADEFSRAQKLWQSGFMARQDALTELAKSYNSSIFSRLIESINRSLKLGTSLAECLQASAAEARTTYRAQREEAVRKAPIKMLIPTAALILPAMLILVLGPILLDLASGGGM